MPKLKVPGLGDACVEDWVGPAHRELAVFAFATTVGGKLAWNPTVSDLLGGSSGLLIDFGILE